MIAREKKTMKPGKNSPLFKISLFIKIPENNLKQICG
jgi:hypothetical protein